MSGQATGWVLRHGPKDRAMRAVLLTIADAANRDGEHAHPGTEAMIEGSLYGRATVYATVRKLLDDGWIEVEEKGGGRGIATVYRVCMERVQRTDRSPRERVQQSDRSGAETVQSVDKKPSNREPETVQSAESSPYSATEKPTVKSNAVTAIGGDVGADIERLCTLLADLIEANGSKRPAITAKWRLECDRLMRLDERTPEQIERAIRWSQRDVFWRANVLSMPTLREKYDQLRLARLREVEASSGPGRRPTGVDAVASYAEQRGLLEQR